MSHLIILDVIKRFINIYNSVNPSLACPVLANNVDPDKLASLEANWSGSALFVIKYVNF